MRPPPPELVERFAADLAALAPADARIGLAVSGGPDSLAMLLLAHAAGLTIEAATVDHALREGSAAEAAAVGRICAALGVRHATLTLPERGRGNLSDWARRERYKALERWADARALSVIATAHHAEDQLETMLMRLNRGSGVAGLAGVRARTGRVIRPLLGWRRDALAAIVRAAGLEAADDPSNRDERFDRARLRKALAGADWLNPRAAATSAAALAEADAALDWAATEAARTRVVRTAQRIDFDPRGLPDELVRRLTGAILMELAQRPTPPRADALARAIATLSAGRTATLAGVKCRGGEVWGFVVAPGRRGAS